MARGGVEDPKRKSVPRCAVRTAISAGVIAHARRAADRRLHVGASEAHTTSGESVDMWRLERRMAVAREIVPTQLVGHDPKDVLGRPAAHRANAPRCSQFYTTR